MFGKIFVCKDEWHLLSKREKRKVNHVHPYININFRHTTYKENVVKNQELFQVCDHFFSFLSLMFDSAVNNQLFDTFLNQNFTVRELNLSQGGGILNWDNFDCCVLDLWWSMQGIGL